MTEAVAVILAFFLGGLLGAMFFGGLWWTVRTGMSAQQPGILFAGSFMLRTLLCVAGFYFVANGDWQRLVSSLIGFVCARFVVVRLTESPSSIRPKTIREGGL